MKLEVLPTRTAGAAENMAIDFLLLQRYPDASTPRFRHYEWRAPAFTFGYAQKIDFVRKQLAPGGSFDLCRRPTGGGIVDHREDWTYALVLPRGHPLEESRATQSYRAVHEALADALREQGVNAGLKAEPVSPRRERGNGPSDVAALARRVTDGVCFDAPEVFDVVHAAGGAKIAGAAQKRNKHGLLVQGSIWRPAASVSGAAVDWARFEEDFVARLAATLGGAAAPVPWPELSEDEVSGLTEHYSASEWIGYR